MKKLLMITMLALTMSCIGSSQSKGMLSYNIGVTYQIAEEEGLEPQENGTTNVVTVDEWPIFSGGEVADKLNAIYKRDESYPSKFDVVTDTTAHLATAFEDAAGWNYINITLIKFTIHSDLLSIKRTNHWRKGGVYDIHFDTKTFNIDTGQEVKITDLLHGDYNQILQSLKPIFEKENGETSDNTEVYFWVTDQGIEFAVDGIYGYQRGCTAFIPWNDALVKLKFN
ncbi:MAG: hypothetical protein LBN93_11015 [Candidatus Symbiothrix sp.]|jgi:hypothetical protein|nr:hypothetical protein [Candidatus Symbiothrix sp.]